MSTATIIEDYTPIYVGDTGAIFAPAFQYANGTPVPLTGAVITMKMMNTVTGSVKTCSGTWIIDDAPNGRAHYQWQAADVNTAGTWELEVTITTNGNPIHADQRVLEIKPIF